MSTSPLRAPSSFRSLAMAAVFVATSCVGRSLFADGGVEDDSTSAPTLTGKPWIDMNHGPFLSTALEVSPGNIAHKGLAIRLDAGPGGVSQGSEFAVFDTDTLRWAAGWAGPDLCDWRSIVWDGSHQTHPSIVGEVMFENPPGPGWALPGTATFDDPRITGRDGVHYGPLPRDYARFRGLHLHGADVVLQYTVGDAAVLELGGVAIEGESRGFTRTVRIGPRKQDLRVRIAMETESRIELRSAASAETKASDGDEARGAHDSIAVFLPPLEEPATLADGNPARGIELDGKTAFEVSSPEAFDLTSKDFTISARVRTRHGGTIFAKAPREGRWQPDGKAFFIRRGRLAYDIGWVGVVESKERVDDGKWHDVAVTFAHQPRRVELWVDGALSGEKELAPREKAEDQAVRIGYASPNFPEVSAFRGAIAWVHFYARVLEADEIAGRRAPREEGLVGKWSGAADTTREPGTLPDESGSEHEARRVPLDRSGSPSREGRHPGGSSVASGRILAVGLRSSSSGLRWATSDRGELFLDISGANEPATFEVVFARVEKVEDTATLAGLLKRETPVRDLEALTRGGPRRWTEEPVTRVSELGPSGGPFEVDVVSLPTENPYRAWMRLGGFDFFPGGKRAAICTWNGDVWTVDGLAGELSTFRWQRVATGLYQPLGLVIADGSIFVLGRDQITRLHDLNGDGEADFYESFNNDAQVTEHFHEFAMDLQRGSDGAFYYTKGGRHALDAVVPHHGTLLRVAPDGSRTDIIATGFRAPNGLWLEPDGTFIVSDQEGHWTPENRINHVRAGGFYGYRFAYDHPPLEDGYDGPLAWVDHDVDISPAEQLRVRSESWGELDGKLLSLSYGTGEIFLVLEEDPGGGKQGGVVRLPVPAAPTGLIRGRFHPSEDHLFTCGLFGWSSRRTQPGGFYRIRRTEAALEIPIEIRSTTGGVALRFSAPLDERRAQSTGSYRVEEWDYRWLARYGTDDFRTSDGEPGRETREVTGVRIASDRRSIYLEIDGMRPAMQQRIDYRLRGARGTRIAGSLWHTVRALGDEAAALSELGFEADSEAK